MVQAENQCPFIRAVEQRPMGIGWILGWDGEALVVGLDERWQEGVGRLDVGDAPQAQLLDQAVLEGLVGPLDPALGLWGIGMDGLDVEGLEARVNWVSPPSYSG